MDPAHDKTAPSRELQAEPRSLFYYFPASPCTTSVSHFLSPPLLLNPTSRSLATIAITEGGRQGGSPQRWTPSLPHCWELHLSLYLTAGSYTSLSPSPLVTVSQNLCLQLHHGLADLVMWRSKAAGSVHVEVEAFIPP